MKSRKLYVVNLGRHVTYEQLEDLFSKYGEVEEVTRQANSDFGFVEMSSCSEAERAKQALNGCLFDGQAVIVDEARPSKKNKSQIPRRQGPVGP